MNSTNLIVLTFYAITPARMQTEVNTDGVDAVLAEFDYDLRADGKNADVTETDHNGDTTRIDWTYDNLGPYGQKTHPTKNIFGDLELASFENADFGRSRSEKRPRVLLLWLAGGSCRAIRARSADGERGSDAGRMSDRFQAASR